jgi:hypothetical protein
MTGLNFKNDLVTLNIGLCQADNAGNFLWIKACYFNDAEQHDVIQALRKHNLSHSVFVRWKSQFNSSGIYFVIL